MLEECNIRVLGLPGAQFNSPAAIEEYKSYAEAVEAALADYDKSGCEATLLEELGALGFNYEEIEWHADNPGKRKLYGYFSFRNADGACGTKQTRHPRKVRDSKTRKV